MSSRPNLEQIEIEIGEEDEGLDRGYMSSMSPTARGNTVHTSESNTAVDGAHVLVDLAALRERREARPADVDLAADARHVVAARGALDGHLAVRAVLHIVSRLPQLEQLLVLRVRSLARRVLVRLRVAVRADPHEARRALQQRRARPRGRCRRRCAVDLWAIRGRAVVELRRTLLNVRGERGVYDSVELLRRKQPLRGCERDRLRASRRVREAGQRERLRVDGGVEVARETRLAPGVAARERDGVGDVVEADGAECRAPPHYGGGSAAVREGSRAERLSARPRRRG